MVNKPLLLIDLRAIQDFKKTGVHIAGLHWVRELIKQSRNDEEIIIWTNSHKQKIELPDKWLKKKNVKQVHTKKHNTFLNIMWGLSNFYKLEKLLNLKKKYIYFSPDIRPFPKSKSIHKSFVYIHDTAFLERKHDFSIKSRIWFKIINPKKIVKQTSSILTNSIFSKNKILELLKAKQISIIHPALPKKLIIKKIKLPQPNYYLCISSIQKRKNLNNLIKKFKNNKKETLIIVGQKSKTFSKTNLRFYKNITCLENISDEQKHYLIKNCKAMIYPSFYEGFGLPILEASRLNKKTYTKEIEPFTQLFPKEVISINNLFRTKEFKKTNTRLFLLKNEIKKLRKHLYKH